MASRPPENPMTPDEVVIGHMGGKKYGPAALAEHIVYGDISSGDIRKVIGVNEFGELIYQDEVLLPDIDLLPPQALDPLGGRRHRP